MPDIKTNSDLVPSARADGDAVMLSVRGEVDLHNSPDLRGVLLEILRDHKPKKLIVNLSLCPYMDSSAIAVLVETLQKVRKAGGKIYLTSLQPRVRGLLEIARLDTIFVLANDDEDALKK
jgi:anti-sigma B factor antagonist